MRSLLIVEDLDAFYGAIQALRGVSFRVEAGEIVALIGANGAGKTTTLRAIAGVLRPRSGRILLDGESIAGQPADRVVRRGIALVPEGRGIFANLSVLENLEMGAFSRRDGERVREDLERVFCRFPRLRERERQLAGTLSGGEQQMLAIGRALLSRPRLLLLDEPSMGLSPLLVSEIFRLVGEINREGTTILLVEQNANMALAVSHRAYVLDTGRVTFTGPSASLRDDPAIRASYLGE